MDSFALFGPLEKNGIFGVDHGQIFYLVEFSSYDGARQYLEPFRAHSQPFHPLDQLVEESAEVDLAQEVGRQFFEIRNQLFSKSSCCASQIPQLVLGKPLKTSVLKCHLEVFFLFQPVVVGQAAHLPERFGSSHRVLSYLAAILSFPVLSIISVLPVLAYGPRPEKVVRSQVSRSQRLVNLAVSIRIEEVYHLFCRHPQV